MNADKIFKQFSSVMAFSAIGIMILIVFVLVIFIVSSSEKEDDIAVLLKLKQVKIKIVKILIFSNFFEIISMDSVCFLRWLIASRGLWPLVERSMVESEVRSISS